MGRFKKLSDEKATEFMNRLIDKSYSQWPALPAKYIVGYKYAMLIEQEPGKTPVKDYNNWAFFRPLYISNKLSNGDFHWSYSDGITQQEVDIDFFSGLGPDALLGVWEDLEYDAKVAGANQDLSKILDDFELTGSVPNGSGNNWIWNPESTRRWPGITLGRLENSRLIWGDERVAQMMISNLNKTTPTIPETINFYSVRYK